MNEWVQSHWKHHVRRYRSHHDEQDTVRTSSLGPRIFTSKTFYKNSVKTYYPGCYLMPLTQIPKKGYQFSSVQLLGRVWPCDPMNRSTPGLPVHHQLPESTQTHVHWVGDAIQPSHPLSSPSPPALNLSQHQGLFQWVSSLHQVAQILEFQLQHQSFQWTSKTVFLLDGLVGSLCSPRDSQEPSSTPQFKSINSSVLSFLYSPTLTSIRDYWKNHSLD